MIVITTIIEWMGIRAEIKQGKPFPRKEQEAFVALQRTADLLMHELAELLKAHGLSPTQYNVLRILRGAGAEGLPCGEVAGRMITRDPDVTRLLDRLEKHGLVARDRDKRDRRVILARITEAGLDLLAALDRPVGQVDRAQFAALDERDLRKLIDLLDRIRSRQRR